MQFMTKVICLILFTLMFAVVPFAQKSEPWRHWNRDDANRILNDSPWGHTQTETDTSEMFFSPTRPGTASIGQSPVTRGRASEQQSINNNRADRGATNEPVSVHFRIRLLSAKPVRQAFVRLVELREPVPDEDLLAQLIGFANRDLRAYIIVAVDVESQDRRFSGPALQALAAATAFTLKNTTYLERKDGKRLFLMDYRAPIADGLGAKFVFPRFVQEKPFLDLKSGDVRFYSDISKDIKLNVKYRISEMLYDGKLEY